MRNLLDNEMEEIISLYEKILSIPKKKPKEQFLICPIGLIGAGKTTVIKPLSKRLSLLRISSDEIRKILEERGFNDIRIKEMAAKIIEKYVPKGFSIAIDADCVDKDGQKYINKFAKQTKIKIFWIHINPPEEFIIKKLKKHKPGWLLGSSKEAVKRYLNRKPLHKNLNIPFIYKFDTSRNDLNRQIEEAISLIKKKVKI